MRIVLITQDDPFFLGQTLDYFLSRLPRGTEAVGCILLKASPFGKRETFLQKAQKTRSIFGTPFFLRYARKFALNKLNAGNKVGLVLEKHNVPILTLEKTINAKSSLEAIAALKPDLLISIAGNQIFKRKLIDLAPKGCLNLHSALLPKYRGLMPSFWVLKNREKYTGVSIFYVDEGIDTGPILVQKRIEIGNKTQEQLIRESKFIGMDAIIESIQKIDRGDTSTLANNDDDATYFGFPTPQDVAEFRASGARFY